MQSPSVGKLVHCCAGKSGTRCAPKFDAALKSVIIMSVHAKVCDALVIFERCGKKY